MTHPPQGRINIGSESDIVVVRKTVREIAAQMAFGTTDVTRIVTAASELARNVYHYAGSGVMQWNVRNQAGRRGIELVFMDEGPGIADVAQAMEVGYTTRGGLGLGLPGAKRLMDEMTIDSVTGRGTVVKAVKWLRT